MKSNLERIYNHKDDFDILNKRNFMFYSNPFYLVNNYINNIDRHLNHNFINNLNDLQISNTNEFGYNSNYDYKNNIVNSKDSKSDVFALLHVASNNRKKEYTGIITPEGVGYGLNNGLTDYYTNKINGKKIVYPIEALVAKTLDKICQGEVSLDYFENEYRNFIEYDDCILNLMKLVDQYHDNYIELIECYRNKFEKERFYYNSIYGRQLKEKNIQLQELYNKISKLEYNNYTLVEKIHELLLDIIYYTDFNYSDMHLIAWNFENELETIISKENFGYLSNLINSFEWPRKGKKLIK